MSKTYIDELAEEIATLRDYYDKAITREREMATKFNNAYWENQQLKELLKECRDVAEFTKTIVNKNKWFNDVIAKIDEVLK